MSEMYGLVATNVTWQKAEMCQKINPKQPLLWHIWHLHCKLSICCKRYFIHHDQIKVYLTFKQEPICASWFELSVKHQCYAYLKIVWTFTSVLVSKISEMRTFQLSVLLFIHFLAKKPGGGIISSTLGLMDKVALSRSVRDTSFFFNKLTSSLVDVEISTLKSIAFKINLQT